MRPKADQIGQSSAIAAKIDQQAIENALEILSRNAAQRVVYQALGQYRPAHQWTSGALTAAPVMPDTLFIIAFVQRSQTFIEQLPPPGNKVVSVKIRRARLKRMKKGPGYSCIESRPAKQCQQTREKTIFNVIAATDIIRQGMGDLHFHREIRGVTQQNKIHRDFW